MWVVCGLLLLVLLLVVCLNLLFAVCLGVIELESFDVVLLALLMVVFA